MQKVTKYVIFRTKWGYFGLAGTEYAICRTCLPGPSPEKLKSHLLKTLLLPHRASLIRRLVRRPVLRSISEGGSVSEVGSFSDPFSAAAAKPLPLRRVEGGSIELDKAFFKPIQEQIAAYFENVCVNFGPDIPVMLDGFSEFQKAVLTVCRDVFFGQIITYIELARKSGRPSAPRAVGNALANNPLPLIIPCHRVIRSDGSLGGFSGLGGLSLKRKLLAHEQNPLSATVLLHHPPAEAGYQASPPGSPVHLMVGRG